jgi:hypothetical protein
VEVDDNEITLRAGETGRGYTFRVPNTIVFAAPLRTSEGRDELVVITHAQEAQIRRWSLLAYRFDGSKIVRSIEPSSLYQITSSNARWIGADLEEVELYLELTSKPDTIEVGGLLTSGPAQGPWRDVVVISPVSVARRSGKSAPAEGVDAGLGEPGTGAPHAKP